MGSEPRYTPKHPAHENTEHENTAHEKSPEKQFFLEDEEIYIYTNKNHKFIGQKVLIDNQLKYFNWHPSGKAFRIVKTSNAEVSPYRLPNQAHETLVFILQRVLKC